MKIYNNDFYKITATNLFSSSSFKSESEYESKRGNKKERESEREMCAILNNLFKNLRI